MAGGKATWVECETVIPNSMNNNPAKGGMRSKTAITISGAEGRYVGKVNLLLLKRLGIKGF